MSGGDARGAGTATGSRVTRAAARSIVAWAIGFVAVALVASVDGSPFHPLLPEDAAPWGPLEALSGAVGLDVLSRDALAAVGIAAVLLSVAGFLLLALEAWRGTVPVRLVVVLAVAAHLVVLALPLLFSRDVYSYAIYGRIASVHGANPYVAVPAEFPGDSLLPLVGRQWRETPAVYGPAFTALSVGLTRVLDDVGALIAAYRAIAVGASLGVLAIVVGLVRRVRPARASFAAVLVGANPVILFHAVGGGHNDLLVGLAIAGGLALAWRGRTLLAAAALALGAVVKAPAAVPLLLLVWVVAARRPAGERLRATLADTGVAVAVALAFAAPFLQTKDPTLGQLGLAGHEGWLAPSRFFRRTLGEAARAVAGEGAAGAVELAVRLAFPVLFLVVLVWLLRWLLDRARAPDGLGPGEQGAAWGWLLVVSLLCAPVLLPWYVAWVAPLAWLLPRAPRIGVVALSAVLAATEVVAEPLRSPRVFEAMVLGIHYIATPAAFAVLVWVVLDLRRRLRAWAPLEAGDRDRVAAPAGDG